MQIVYLSARPEILKGTIAAARAHLGFVDRYLAVVPERMRAEVARLGIEVVSDEDLLGSLPEDHQRRNYELRTALAGSDAVAGVFLMSDDDSRPLVDLEETVFVNEGKHRRYTFGGLDEWTHLSTSFDAGQHASRQVLGLLGSPRRAYASHMPQVIDKALLGEVAGRLAPVKHPLCEWAAYFNLAPEIRPGLFHEPEPYVTLGWPENPAAWQPTLEPGSLRFENFFPEHYRPGSVYQGLDPDDHSFEIAVEKAVRWRSYELEVLAGERAPTIGAPPPTPSTGRLLRQVRNALAGDPVKRERDRRADLAAAIRFTRRP